MLIDGPAVLGWVGRKLDAATSMKLLEEVEATITALNAYLESLRAPL